MQQQWSTHQQSNETKTIFPFCKVKSKFSGMHPTTATQSATRTVSPALSHLQRHQKVPPIDRHLFDLFDAADVIADEMCVLSVHLAIQINCPAHSGSPALHQFLVISILFNEQPH
jgi:hypothetical protein